MGSITVSTELTTITCPHCSGLYAITQEFLDEARRKGDFLQCWSCPYCKASRGYGEGELQRKTKEIARLQSRIEHKEAALNQVRLQRDAADNSRRALKGVVTRTKRRVGHGVCPCCNRTFKDLADHMKAKHPSYVE